MAQTNEFMHTGIAVAKNGVDVIADTSAHTGKWKAFSVGAAANVDSLTETGADTRVGASTGLTGVALSPGYYAANGYFTAITLTSGQVSMIRDVD